MKEFRGAIISFAVACVVCYLLSGCAHVHIDKESKKATFYGFGSYKDKEIEITSDPPIKDIFSIKLGTVK